MIFHGAIAIANPIDGWTQLFLFSITGQCVIVRTTINLLLCSRFSTC